jgi:Cu-Zn family superoxide dismutase
MMEHALGGATTSFQVQEGYAMRKFMFLGLIIGLIGFAASAEASNVSARIVRLNDADGNSVGTVRVSPIGTSVVRVQVSVHNLPTGFHGFHVHSVAMCEPPFTSAGGHLNPAGASHPGHSGDMPVLYVTEAGRGRMEFITDRFSMGDLFDADGSAIIVHAKPDNYANIPTDRYDPDPDATTLNTGDAGPRVACGVIEKR